MEKHAATPGKLVMVDGVYSMEGDIAELPGLVALCRKYGAALGVDDRLTVSDTDYFIDLLFYHVRLRCYVVVELKAIEFRPEHAGKLNFYLSAVDDLLKQHDDQPSIGLLLCRSRKRLHVEYALRDINKPMGVAEWETRLVEKLPDDFKGSLPTVDEIEAELATGRKDSGQS